MNDRELEASAAHEDEVDAVLLEVEPLIARGQMKLAVTRLWELFEARLAEDVQNARRLIEMTHLIGGERRTGQLTYVDIDRRDDHG